MGRLIGSWNKMPLTVKVSTAYAFCSILQKGLSFITLPLFTRLLTTAQYGQVTIYGSWQGILTIFLTLNLAYGSFSTAMIKFEDDREGYISAVEGISVVLTVLFFIAYLPFHTQWNKLFELPTYIVCIMVAEILAANAIYIWNGKKRFEFKYKAVIAVTLAMSVLSPIIQYILVISNDEKGYARIIGAALVTIAVGGCFFAYNALKGKIFYKKSYWKYALGFNIPLLAYYLSQIIFNQSDRIMISHMVGKEKAAIYGVAYSLAMVLSFVLNAINNAYVPWLYGRIKKGKTIDNKKISLAIAAVMALLLLAIIWFAPEIIRIMAGRKYAEAVYVVPPVAISLLLLFYSQLFINVEFYYEEKKKLIWASIVAAIVNLVLNVIFISRFGFIAAAYTTLASYILFALCNYMAMKSMLKEKSVPDEGFNYKALAILLMLFISLSYIGVVAYKFLAARIVVAAMTLAVMIAKRNSFARLLRMLKE